MLYKKFVQKVQWILFQTQPLNKSIPFQTQHMNRRYVQYPYKTNIRTVGTMEKNTWPNTRNTIKYQVSKM